MSLAEDTRDAVRRRPFLLAALRAGVANYTAAARSLSDDVDGDTESIATALRRFEESLSERETDSRSVRVSMRSGLGTVGDGSDSESGDSSDPEPGDDSESESGDARPESGDAFPESEDALLAVGGTRLAPGAGSLTGVVASGDVDASALSHVLGRLNAVGIEVRAAGVGDDALVVAVERRDGPDAVRVVENALDAVPGR